MSEVELYNTSLKYLEKSLNKLNQKKPINLELIKSINSKYLLVSPQVIPIKYDQGKIDDLSNTIVEIIRRLKNFNFKSLFGSVFGSSSNSGNSGNSSSNSGNTSSNPGNSSSNSGNSVHNESYVGGPDPNTEPNNGINIIKIKNKTDLMDPSNFLCPKYVEMDFDYISKYYINESGASLIYPGYLFVANMMNSKSFSNGVTTNRNYYLVTCFDRSKLRPLIGEGEIRGNGCEVLQYMIKTSDERSNLHRNTYFNIYYSNSIYTINYKTILPNEIKDLEHNFILNRETEVTREYIFKILFIKESTEQFKFSPLFPGYKFNYRMDFVNNRFYLTVSRY
jgi:hypothetical protein